MPNILDEFLAEQGLSFDQLTSDQRQQYLERLEILQMPEFNVDALKSYLFDKKAEVESELIDTNEFEYYFFGVFKRVNRQHLLLKARLRNYLQLELFLKTPDQRKRQVEAEIKMSGMLAKRRKSGLL